MSDPTPELPRRWLTKQEAIAYTKVGKTRTFEKFVRKYAIAPSRPFGRVGLYDIADLDRVLEACKHVPASDEVLTQRARKIAR